MRCWGGREKMYSPTSGLKTFHPRRMWRSREWDLYWIRTMMLRNPELMQLLRVKSMIRYLPPKGTAGLARSAVNGWRRSPRPPDRIMVKRSEEHTSELQSRLHLVCRLLLEKKKRMRSY